MNILLITSDQHHPGFIHCGGHPQIETPNLDRFAAEGTLFKRAYCATPTCTPSRASILTGQMPSRHRAYSIGVDLPEDCVSVADILHRNGYDTHIVGKAHFKRCGTEGSFESPPNIWNLDFFKGWEGPYYGFDKARLCIGHTCESESYGMHYGLWLKGNGIGHGEFFIPRDAQDKSKYYQHAGKWDLPEEFHPSKWVADEACRLMEESKAKDRPFFLWASFQDPHSPIVAPSPWCDMYSPDTVETFDGEPDEFRGKPDFYGLIRGNRFDSLPWASRNNPIKTPAAYGSAFSKEEWMRRTAVYMGMISLMDHHIGRIAGKLKSLGIEDDTLVVFTSDHGEYLNSHGFMAKGLPAYDDCQRVPFIVKAPGQRAKGGVSDALVSLVDFAPTALSLAGLEIPCEMQGADQSSVWLGQEGAVRDSLVVENRPVLNGIYQKTLVAGRHKLVVYDNDEWGELYDMQEDPGQKSNLYWSSGAAGLRAELLRKLIKCEMDYERRREDRTSFA